MVQALLLDWSWFLMISAGFCDWISASCFWTYILMLCTICASQLHIIYRSATLLYDCNRTFTFIYKILLRFITPTSTLKNELAIISINNFKSFLVRKWSRLVVFDSLRPHGLQPTRLLHPWNFPGKSTGVGCHFLLHGSNLGLPHCRQMLYHLNQGSPSGKKGGY